GYPPSQVPTDPGSYSQARAADDIRSVLDALDIDRAHVVGLSMGGFATLHFGLRYPHRALSLVVAGVGYGAEPDQTAEFRQLSEQAAQQCERLGSAGFAPLYASGASRVQFQNKDPRGWAEFAERLAQHDALGSANTMRGVQARRPSLYNLEPQLRELTVPTLIVSGDEDDHCLQPSLFLKRTIPACGLWILPKTGHPINLEEPAAFNKSVHDFLCLVTAGAWRVRDTRASGSSMKVSDAP